MMRAASPSFLVPVGLACLLLAGMLSACGEERAQSCIEYEACVEHYATEFDFETTPDITTYQEGGDCWRDATTARNCAEECQQTTEALKEALTIANKTEGPCDP